MGCTDINHFSVAARNVTSVKNVEMENVKQVEQGGKTVVKSPLSIRRPVMRWQSRALPGKKPILSGKVKFAIARTAPASSKQLG
jgi:hypothetical protein